MSADLGTRNTGQAEVGGGVQSAAPRPQVMGQCLIPQPYPHMLLWGSWGPGDHLGEYTPRFFCSQPHTPLYLLPNCIF